MALATVTSLLQAPTRQVSLNAVPPQAYQLRHAAQLRDRGYTVVRTASLQPELISAANDECSYSLARLLDGVEALGLDVMEQKYLFSEVTTRHRLRWDFRPERAVAFNQLVQQAASEIAVPIIKTMHTLPPNLNDGWLPRLTGATRFLLPATPLVAMTGAIISQPGAKAQRFHADAADTHFRLARLCPRHRLFNVFIPLVDIEADGDGTMLWPSSHLEQMRYEKYSRAVSRSGHLEDDGETMGEMRAPAMKAGDVLIFDYRLVHRGLPSIGRERCMAYAVLSTGLAWDASNFPSFSLRDAVDSLPDESDERELLRREFRKSFGFWSELRERETDEAPLSPPNQDVTGTEEIM